MNQTEGVTLQAYMERLTTLLWDSLDPANNASDDALRALVPAYRRTVLGYLKTRSVLQGDTLITSERMLIRLKEQEPRWKRPKRAKKSPVSTPPSQASAHSEYWLLWL